MQASRACGTLAVWMQSSVSLTCSGTFLEPYPAGIFSTKPQSMGNTSLPRQSLLLTCSGHRGNLYFIFFVRVHGWGGRAGWSFLKVNCLVSWKFCLNSFCIHYLQIWWKKKKKDFQDPLLFFLCSRSMTEEIIHDDWYQSIEIPSLILSTTEITVKEYNCSSRLYICKKKPCQMISSS